VAACIYEFSDDQSAMGYHGDQEKTVVVLGLARSGTSVVTAMLGAIGVEMGSSLYDKANPLGSFEDDDFAALHKEIFELAGSDKNYWNPPNPEEILSLRESRARQIQQIVAQKSKKDKIWGWKHPRTVLTIELFLPHLRNPHFVAVFRNPLGIANSSVEHTKNYKLGKVDFLQALKLTSFYYGEMFKILERNPDVPTISVAFEEVVTQPIQEAKRLADFLGVEFTEAAKTQIECLVISREEIGKEKKRARGLGGKIPRLFQKYTRTLRGKKSFGE
jgi:hypothetical protein